MISGIVTPLLKNGRWAYRLSLFASGAGVLLSGVLLGRIGPANESFSFMMGNFPASGQRVIGGELEAVLATAVCLVMMMALLGGSRDIFEDVLPEKQKLYFIMMDEILAALLALTYTNDIFYRVRVHRNQYHRGLRHCHGQRCQRYTGCHDAVSDYESARLRAGTDRYCAVVLHHWSSVVPKPAAAGSGIGSHWAVHHSADCGCGADRLEPWY